MSSEEHAQAVTKHTAIVANAAIRLSWGLRSWFGMLAAGVIYGPLKLRVQQVEIALADDVDHAV